MSLFQWGDFKLHSGEKSWWRIDCDSLTDSEVELLAKLIHEKIGNFSGITCPSSHKGSLPPKLVNALGNYMTNTGPFLIVDDVLTTGSSMEEVYQAYQKYVTVCEDNNPAIVGAVIFARGKCPKWITPLFQFNGG